MSEDVINWLFIGGGIVVAALAAWVVYEEVRDAYNRLGNDDDSDY